MAGSQIKKYYDALGQEISKRDENSWQAVIEGFARSFDSEEADRRAGDNIKWVFDMKRNKVSAAFFLGFVQITNHQGRAELDLESCRNLYDKLMGKELSPDHMRKKLTKWVYDGWLKKRQKGKSMYYSLALTEKETKENIARAKKTLGILADEEKGEK